MRQVVEQTEADTLTALGQQVSVKSRSIEKKKQKNSNSCL